MKQTGLVTTYPDDGCERCNEWRYGSFWNYTEDTFCDDCTVKLIIRLELTDFHFYKLLDGSQYRLRKLLEWENL